MMTGAVGTVSRPMLSSLVYSRRHYRRPRPLEFGKVGTHEGPDRPTAYTIVCWRGEELMLAVVN